MHERRADWRRGATTCGRTGGRLKLLGVEYGVMAVCDICEKRKSNGTKLVARTGEMWVCRGCMMKAVTGKREELSFAEF
jgi:hypothetical protein